MCRVREKAESLSLYAEFFTLDKRSTMAAASVTLQQLGRYWGNWSVSILE
jgi:hypothetical protein